MMTPDDDDEIARFVAAWGRPVRLGWLVFAVGVLTGALALAAATALWRLL